MYALRRKAKAGQSIQTQEFVAAGHSANTASPCHLILFM